jgi:hypothetical protein
MAQAASATSWGVLRAEGGQPAQLDRAEVLRACSVLFDPAHSVELRGLPSGRSFVRPGGDHAALADCAARLATDRGVYFCLNPVSIPAEADRAARVADVVRRRWLLIDIDPARPADTNATAGEKAAAQALMADLMDWLAARGWPMPAVIDSGNGWHLLYRIDTEADDPSRVLVREFLKALAARFDTDAARVDPSVHNASRISKLPGTWARKGPHSADRPHRLASVYHMPQPAEVVPAGKIREAIDELNQAGADTVVEGGPPPDADALRGLAMNADNFVQEAPSAPQPEGWGTLQADAGPDAYERATHYVDTCGEAVSGAKGHSKTMSVARGVVWGFALGVDRGLRLMLDRYNSRCKPPWTEAELRHKCEDAEGTPDPSGRPRGYLLEEPGRAAWPNGKKTKAPEQPAGVKRPSIYRLSDLMEMQLPPPVWVVPGLLSEGLTILAGKPKLGKSWLALNVALTVAAGGKVLGQMEARPGAVLYLSLEDRLRRVQDRARKLLAGTGVAVSRRLSIAVEWPRQDSGGLDEIALWAEREENPSLVIIDVWQKFRPPTKGSGGYDQDYSAMGQLKSVIDEKRLSAIVVHHCKKAAAEDALEEVSGTNGLAGAADGVLVLSRARNENEGSLFITGRDFEEKKLAVLFDPKTFVWTSLGDAEYRVQSQLGKKVLDMLKSAGPGASFWPREITERLKAESSAVRTVLLRLLDKGLVQRKGAGMYSWPEEGAGDAVPF